MLLRLIVGGRVFNCTHVHRHITHLLDDGGFACFVRGADLGFHSQAQTAIDVRPVAGAVAGFPEPSAAWRLLGFIVVRAGIKVRGHRSFPLNLGWDCWAGFVVVKVHRRDLEGEPGLLILHYGVAFGDSLDLLLASLLERLLLVLRGGPVQVERDMDLEGQLRRHHIFPTTGR